MQQQEAGGRILCYPPSDEFSVQELELDGLQVGIGDLLIGGQAVGSVSMGHHHAVPDGAIGIRMKRAEDNLVFPGKHPDAGHDEALFRFSVY